MRKAAKSADDHTPIKAISREDSDAKEIADDILSLSKTIKQQCEGLIKADAEISLCISKQ